MKNAQVKNAKKVDTDSGHVQVVRLGVDIPPDTKMKFAIETRKANMTMTEAADALVNIGTVALKAGMTFEQLEALVRAWAEQHKTKVSL